MQYRLWWVLIFLLIFADMGITYWAVTTDRAEESNPAVKEAMEKYGIIAALIGGATVRIASMVLAMVVQKWLPRYKWSMPLIGITAQSPPVIWNVFVLLI